LQLGNLDRRVNIQSATRLLGPSSCSIFLWLLTEVLETQRKIGGLCFGTRPAKAGPNSYRLGLAKPIEPSLERKKRAWMLGMPWSFRPENTSHQPISSSLLTRRWLLLLLPTDRGGKKDGDSARRRCHPTSAARTCRRKPGGRPVLFGDHDGRQHYHPLEHQAEFRTSQKATKLTSVHQGRHQLHLHPQKFLWRRGTAVCYTVFDI
jgi:hypothetical protein